MLYQVAEHDDYEPTNHHPVEADSPENAAIAYADARNLHRGIVLAVEQFGPGRGYLASVGRWLVEVAYVRAQWAIVNVEPR